VFGLPRRPAVDRFDRQPSDADLHRWGFTVPSVPARQQWATHRNPPWVNSLPLRVSSHTSSVGAGGLVSVSAPAVSNSGLAPGHLSERWGDFPHGGARWHPSHGNRALSTQLGYGYGSHNTFDHPVVGD